MKDNNDKKTDQNSSKEPPFPLTMEFYRNLAEQLYDNGGLVDTTKESEAY